jgi:glycosyltransferase involved in cell wall biosynthesis
MFGLHRRDREGIEADYAIPPNKIVAVFVGRLDVGKNIYTLIDAMADLIKEGLPLHLIAAGIGPAADAIKEKLGDAATVPGFVSPDELARLYASVDLLALPSEVEIRSMAGVEAMASACPVLVSEKSGVADLFNHTPAMRVVPSGVPAWKEALREFAIDENRRAHMRSVAKAYGQSFLASWQEVLAEDLFAVWQRVADESRRRRA